MDMLKTQSAMFECIKLFTDKPMNSLMVIPSKSF